MDLEVFEQVRKECPEANALIILRTLERIPDKDEAISIIKNRPCANPIYWNFNYSKWMSIDALSIST